MYDVKYLKNKIKRASEKASLGSEGQAQCLQHTHVGNARYEKLDSVIFYWCKETHSTGMTVCGFELSNLHFAELLDIP